MGLDPRFIGIGQWVHWCRISYLSDGVAAKAWEIINIYLCICLDDRDHLNDSSIYDNCVDVQGPLAYALNTWTATDLFQKVYAFPQGEFSAKSGRLRHGRASRSIDCIRTCIFESECRSMAQVGRAFNCLSTSVEWVG